MKMCSVLPRIVFPTPVGVFLGKRHYTQMARSLPHARGGVSYLHMI